MIVAKALAGDIHFCKLILDRTEGKVPEDYSFAVPCGFCCLKPIKPLLTGRTESFNG